MARIITPNGRGYRRPLLDAPNLLNCGFSATRAKLAPFYRPEKQVIGKTFHSVPISCNPTKRVQVSRVAQFAGVDNSLFLVGSVDNGMVGIQENLNIHMPSDTVNYTGGNFACYLLVKAGGDMATHFSTDNIETGIWNLRHAFTAKGINTQLVEEGSLEIGLDNEQNTTNAAVEFIRVTSEPSCIDSSIHIQLVINDCGVMEKETWLLFPLRTQNSMILRGMNLAEWVDNAETFGNQSVVPAFSTDNGTICVLSVPTHEMGFCDPCGTRRGDEQLTVQPSGYVGFGNGYGHGFGGFGRV